MSAFIVSTEQIVYDEARARFATYPTWYVEDWAEAFASLRHNSARIGEQYRAAHDILNQRAPTAIPPTRSDGKPSWRAYYAGWTASLQLSEAQKLATELMQIDEAHKANRRPMNGGYHAALYHRYDVLEAMRTTTGK